MEIKVLKNQSVSDIAIQHTGSVEGVTEICRLNGLSLGSVLEAGQVLNVPSVVEPRIVEYFTLNDPPATKYTVSNVSFTPGFSNGFN